MDKRAKDFLNVYLSNLSKDIADSYHSFSAGYFCSNENDANICAQLVKDDIKTATCALKQSYIAENEPLPIIGHLHIVTDWYGEPTSIIETMQVLEIPFYQVDASFAYKEGEGDRSLEYWEKVHKEFFKQEAKEYQIEFNENSILILEYFKRVF